MKYQVVNISPSHTLRQPHDSEGFYCPVCAEPHRNFPIYASNGRPNDDHICGGCSLHGGYDDEPFRDWSQSYEDYITAYRIKWLDEAGWTKVNLGRLNRVLGVEESELLQDADKLRKEWHHCKNVQRERFKQSAEKMNRYKFPPPSPGN